MDERPTQGACESVLERVAQRCLAELDVDHASIAIANGHGLWSAAYATSSVAADLDLYSYTTGEGPAFDVLRGNGPVLVSDLDHASELRWPAWAPRAREAHVRAVATFPIQAGAIAAGALTLLSESVGNLDRKQLAIALRLADIAFLGLLDVLSGLESDAGSDTDDSDALDALLRVEVHQAAGMVMAQADVGINEALARLRAAAFGADRSITELAADVLARRVRFSPGSGPHLAD